MRLLLVDDRPEDRELIVRRLRQQFQQAELIEVANPATFQQVLDQGPFDLVVTDYQLRWSNGLQVLEEVQRRFPGTPVVMCTDSGNEQVAVAGMHAGLSDYVLKRHLERLPAAILSSLERAELQRKYEEATRELRLSEQRYRTIAGQITDVAYTLQVDANGAMTPEWVSGKLSELTGYDHAEFDGQGWWVAVIHPDDRSIIEEHRARLLSGQPAEDEFRIVTRNGEVHWLRLSDQPEQDSAGERVARIYGGARDVTARRRAEEALQRARDELEIRVQERTAELQQANEFLQRQTEELQLQAEELQMQAEEMETQTEEITIQAEDLRVQGETLLQRNQQLDELNQLSAALNRINALLSASFDVKAITQEVLRQAFQALGVEAAALVWREEDTWVTADEYGLPEETVGHSLDEQPALAAWVAQHPDVLIVDDIRSVDPSAAAPTYPHNVRALLGIPLRQEGQAIAVMTFLYRSRSAGFNPAQVDFGQKLAATLALALENERLHRQAQQDAETKATLLREVNHRVKNNLGAIVGLLYAQLSRPDLAALPQYQTTVLDLTRRVEGLAVVHGMLSSSQWAPLRLDELAERVLQSALQSVPPGRLQVQVQPSPVRVSSNQAHTVALVVNELGLNVAKYALQEHSCQILVEIAPADENQVALVLHDNGPGYPREVLDRQRSGTGLELVRNLVTRTLRGQLVLRNEAGAVTEIRFPADEEAARG